MNQSEPHKSPAMSEGSRESWKQCYRATAKRLPVLTWLPKYSLQWLQLDFMAGMTVGMTVVPQALAYAVVAGLPVEVRLFMQEWLYLT